MKKILLLMIVAIGATSCVEYGAKEQYKEVGDEYDVAISVVEQDGHSYLLFDGYGVVHNPDCECKKMEE